MKNISKLLAPVVVIALLMPAFTLGATLKADDEVSIKKGFLQDNLYVAGGNVSVNSKIDGDLITVGGNVLISEDVSKDITVAGGSITILGDSGDDTRVAGGNILIANNVGGELIVVGGMISISADTSVAKDFVSAGGQINVDGNINGNAKIAGGVVVINGHIKGDVIVKVDDKLTIGDGAIIDGNLEYSSKTAEALELDGNAIINGTTTFKEISGLQVDTAKAKNFLFAALSAFLIFKLLALIITALILAWLFKGFSNSVAKGAIQNPLRFLGKGFVALIITPIASILLFITLFGIPIGLITLLSYILVLLLSCIYTGALVGVWVSQLISKSDKAVITWKNILGGVILLAIVTTIPFIGWIIGFLVFLLTLGSITDIILKKLWTDR